MLLWRLVLVKLCPLALLSEADFQQAWPLFGTFPVGEPCKGNFPQQVLGAIFNCTKLVGGWVII